MANSLHLQGEITCTPERRRKKVKKRDLKCKNVEFDLRTVGLPRHIHERCASNEDEANAHTLHVVQM